MSIALERGFLHQCQYEAPAPAPASCSSSSVGRNSDSDGDNGDGSDGGDESEVQSSYKGPLDSMDALEDSLPFRRRGISKFYCGKSKSFTTLADAISKSPSAKDLAKPESPYNRKRKNLLPFNFISKKSHYNQGGITKKPSLNSSRKVTNMNTSSSGSNSSSSEEDQGQKSLLPPLHPHSRPATVMINDDSNEAMSAPMRSFSMADLQGMVGSSPWNGRSDGQKRRFY